MVRLSSAPGAKCRQIVIATVLLLSAVALSWQTRIAAPANNYSPADDVKLGSQAAAEAERQLPILHDDLLSSYVAGLGRRLTAAIPMQLRHPQFRYSFKVVN